MPVRRRLLALSQSEVSRECCGFRKAGQYRCVHCINFSRRVLWEIDKDVIGNPNLDFAKPFLPRPLQNARAGAGYPGGITMCFAGVARLPDMKR